MDIKELLELRDSNLIGVSGDMVTAHKRAELSKLIAANYTEYSLIKNHIIHPESFVKIPNNAVSKCLLQLFFKLGWIERDGPPHWGWRLATEDIDVVNYLKGKWLEEYTFLAHEAAGCDEIFYSQQLQWKVGDIVGENEIDVISRRGGVLSFTSCKTVQTYGMRNLEKIRAHMLEAEYWDRHFADGNGRVLLVTTADFYDEIHGSQHRYPTLLARASILGVDLVGLEEIKWDKFVKLIKEHWD